MFSGDYRLTILSLLLERYRVSLQNSEVTDEMVDSYARRIHAWISTTSLAWPFGDVDQALIRPTRSRVSIPRLYEYGDHAVSEAAFDVWLKSSTLKGAKGPGQRGSQLQELRDSIGKALSSIASHGRYDDFVGTFLARKGKSSGASLKDWLQLLARKGESEEDWLAEWDGLLRSVRDWKTNSLAERDEIWASETRSNWSRDEEKPLHGYIVPLPFIPSGGGSGGGGGSGCGCVVCLAVLVFLVLVVLAGVLLF